MKIKISVGLLISVCLLAGCAVSIKDSGETTLRSFESDIMKYDSVNQASNKDGIVNNAHTLVGQAKFPAQAITTKQVPGPGAVSAQAPVSPERPKYGRAAKAVPRTSAVSQQKMVTVVETTTTHKGPEVLAISNASGNSTAHDVAAALPGAIGNAVGMTTFGTTFGVVRRPDRTNVQQSQSGGGAKAYGGDAKSCANADASAKAEANADANAKAIIKGGDGHHGGCK